VATLLQLRARLLFPLECLSAHPSRTSPTLQAGASEQHTRAGQRRIQHPVLGLIPSGARTKLAALRGRRVAFSVLPAAKDAHVTVTATPFCC
jgi:hypothetical protein